MISATTISPLNRRIVDGSAPPFPFGNALQFDGVNDYVSVGINLRPSKANNFGGSIWFKSSNLNSVASRVYNPFWGNSAGGWSSAIGLNGGKIATVSYDGSIRYNEGITNYSDGNWHCMTCIRTRGATDGDGTVSVWVDGNLEINEGNWSTGLFYVEWRSIGGNETNRFFDGDLDEIVFYQGVGLSVGLSEHNLFYNNGNGALATDVFTDIYAYYNCNGTSGDSTLLDSINSYNGTLNNFDTATCWVAH